MPILTPSRFALILLTTLYAALSWLVLRADFLEYNADGYTRIIHGYEWLHSPRWEVGVWLPLQTWLFGAGLAIHDSLTFTPRAMSVLFTGWTLINLYFIGRTIGDKWSGVLAVAIAVAFPWTVWLGLSGMAEPLFHALLTTGILGFVYWLRDARDHWLLVAGLGLLLSTMVRYEGWFYAAAYVPIVVGLAWQRGQLSPRVIGLVLLPMLFPLLWMEQHWQHFGDPLRFAHDTAAIKDVLAAENTRAGLLRRLTVYPEETMRLAPRLAALALVATVYALVRRVSWWPLIVLIGGQALLFVGVSAGFSNLGPGAERYLLSNAILLFPILGASLMALPTRSARAIGLAALAFCLIPSLLMVVDPPTDYPDASTRAVAQIATNVLDNRPEESVRIPVLLPADPSDGFYASYGLRVLSNQPDAWLFTSDPQLFANWVQTIRPPLWILDRETGTTPPAAARTDEIGRFTLGWSLAKNPVTLSAGIVTPGDHLSVSASGYAAGELTSAWLTDPAGQSIPLPWDARAGRDGSVTESVMIPGSAQQGSWSITVYGFDSGTDGSAQFEVVGQ